MNVKKVEKEIAPLINPLTSDALERTLMLRLLVTTDLTGATTSDSVN